MARGSSPAERSVVNQSARAVDSHASVGLPLKLRKLSTAIERLALACVTMLQTFPPMPISKLTTTIRIAIAAGRDLTPDNHQCVARTASNSCRAATRLGPA